MDQYSAIFPPNEKMTEYLTILEASKRLKCSPGTVHSMIDAGLIEDIPVGSGTKRKTYRVLSRNGEISYVGKQPKTEEPKQELGAVHPSIERALRKMEAL